MSIPEPPPRSPIERMRGALLRKFVETRHFRARHVKFEHLSDRTREEVGPVAR